MPLSTFHNLSPTRKKVIAEEAIKEFAVHEYEAASLSAIIQRLGLAKGSFYRYFSHKAHLYEYLLQHATQFRLNFEKELFAPPIEDFFELLVDNFAAKIHFDQQYPIYSAFLYQVMQEKHPEVAPLVKALKNQIIGMVIGLLSTSQQKDQLRTDVDLELMAFMVVDAQFSLYEYLEWKLGVDFRENIRKGLPVLSLPESEILQIARAFANLLKQGMLSPTL